MAQNIGKFEIRRLLGKGAQSSVYLAYDPDLEREVAIKTLRFARKNAAQNQALLNEARTVSKLRHANIVPIFEAGEQDGDPYLVFEYIEGRTLAELIRKEGALEPARAVELMIGILDAVAYAHRFGVIHRDLKPSNVLINADGLPRVMDFGIAARVAESGSGEQELQGTPAYMAPEYIAQKVVNPQTDVFSAGLVLYEMAFGRRAVQADNVFQAMHQIANKPIEFPADAGDKVDEKLHDLIAKAVAQDPQMRFESAEQMRDALQRYLKPPLEEPAEGEKKGTASTLEFLLRRMRHKSDFPAMSAAIGAINRLASSEKGNVNVLSNSILKDFALTNKILRVANSALYRQFGGGSISTVSRAIVVLGFNAVRNIALSLMLFEHLQHKQQADQLREEFLSASLSGILGKQLSGAFSVREPEESFICAMFHGLGRLLTHFYFPEEADTITKLVAKESCSEDAAAARVLGISYQELGIGIAESWGFPDTIIKSMKRVPPGKVPHANTNEERLRALSTFSNEVCAAIQTQPPQDRARAIAQLQKRYGDNVKLNEKQLSGVLQKSTEEVGELARAIGVSLKKTRIGKQLLTPEVVAAAEEASKASQSERLPSTVVLSGTFTSGSAAPSPTAEAEAATESAAENAAAPATDAHSVLAAGIQDISQALVEDISLGDLLRIILETMYRAMGFGRVLLCMRDGRNGVMSARFGFGPDVDEAVPRFRFTLGGNADIFNIIVAKDKDVLITDASDPKIVRFIPDWFTRGFSAKTFIVFPLRIKGAPVAMIYAEKDKPGSIAINDKELSLLRTLCNQAVLAIKQSTDRG
jgi:serine/threonine protein kinase